MSDGDEIEWWDYDDAAEMAEAVAGDLQFVIESAIDARGAAVIALSGGKTPIPIYAKLAEMQFTNVVAPFDGIIDTAGWTSPCSPCRRRP